MTIHQLIKDAELSAEYVARRNPTLAVRLHHAVHALRHFHHDLRRLDMADIDVIAIVDRVEAALAAKDAEVAAQKSRADRAEAQLAAEAPNVLTPEQTAAIQKLGQDFPAAPTAPDASGGNAPAPVTDAPPTPAADPNAPAPEQPVA